MAGKPPFDAHWLAGAGSARWSGILVAVIAIAAMGQGERGNRVGGAGGSWESLSMRDGPGWPWKAIKAFRYCAKTLSS